MSRIFVKDTKAIITERQSSYGHPIEDFTRSSGMMASLGFRFQDASGNIRNVAAADIPIIMMCVKMSREMHRHKDDSVLDIAGYANTLNQVYEKQREQAKPKSKAKKRNAKKVVSNKRAHILR